MEIQWHAIGNFIAKLAHVALDWYLVVEGQNGNGELRRQRQRQLAVVIHPDEPEQTCEEADKNGR